MNNKSLRTIFIIVGLVIAGLLVWFFIWYANDDASTEVESAPIEVAAPAQG